ncbi:MAG: hypothetical protein RBR78_01365 [Flavobacteriaceae bacterium]|jgi:hypothetical protein|nr:hypothetical protein [Flavobacteriaceae bacterium]
MSTEKKVEVLGYSERGIINSIVFFLREQPTHIQSFIRKLGVEDDFFNDDCQYTFLNEQSFSEFGNNDWTIIAEKNGEKRVIFIEGKVKTYGKNFWLKTNFEKLKNGQTFDGISSNIFVQLYYKYFLTKVLNEESINIEFSDLPDILKKNKGNSGKVARKTGNNGIVKKAIEKIKGADKYYYVAILPKTNPNELYDKFEELNKTLLKNQRINIEYVRQVFWGDVRDYFEDKSCDIKENFIYNEGQIY